MIFFFVAVYTVFAVISFVVQEDNAKAAGELGSNQIWSSAMVIKATWLAYDCSAIPAGACFLVDVFWLNKAYSWVLVNPVDMNRTSAIPPESSLFPIVGCQAPFVTLHLLLTLNGVIRLFVGGQWM